MDRPIPEFTGMTALTRDSVAQLSAVFKCKPPKRNFSLAELNHTRG